MIAEADPTSNRGRPSSLGKRATDAPEGSAGVLAPACRRRESDATREAPAVAAHDRQPDAREGQAGPCGVTERSVVVTKPGNAGRAKGPWFWNAAGRNNDRAIGLWPSNLKRIRRSGKRLSRQVKMRVAYRGPVGNSVREPDAGNPHVRFDEREVETEHGAANEAPANERAGHR
jgi:hypothetical protein